MRKDEGVKWKITVQLPVYCAAGGAFAVRGGFGENFNSTVPPPLAPANCPLPNVILNVYSSV